MSHPSGQGPAATLLFAGVGLGLLLTMSAAAYACTPTANLVATLEQATPGQAVPVDGRAFVGAAVIDVRFDGRGGSLVWSGSADAAGTFRFSFVVPDVAPGDHYLAAYDRAAAQPGSTAATAFRVLDPAAKPIVDAVPLPPPAPPAPVAVKPGVAPVPAPALPRVSTAVTAKASPSARAEAPAGPAEPGAPVGARAGAAPETPAGPAAKQALASAPTPLPPQADLQFAGPYRPGSLSSAGGSATGEAVASVILLRAAPLGGGLVLLGLAAAVLGRRRPANLPSAATARR